MAAGGPDNGLSELGYGAVKKMNRLGMMVDLWHVSHQTTRDELGVLREHPSSSLTRLPTASSRTYQRHSLGT